VTDDWERRARTAEGRIARAALLAREWADYSPRTYGREDEQRVKFAKAAFTDASTQLTAVLSQDPWTGEPPAQVPDLPCTRCGSPDVSIEYCASDWGAIYPGNRDREHFHRTCRRCSYRWRTDDTLDAPPLSAEAADAP